MSTQQKKAYKEMLGDMVSEFARAKYVKADNILTKVTRLRQITSGFIGGDEKKLNGWAKTNKIAKVGLGVIATDARNLNLWRISRKSTSTTVLMRHSTLGACFIDLTPKKLDGIEEKIGKHFKKIRR